MRLALTVFDTHDLRMELLSYGPTVEVLAPAELREWLREQHAAAALPALESFVLASAAKQSHLRG
ncbi:MAG: WYL domain-containing protein [Hymenobacter sp.]|nr:MAG: WYL domain-containing protein [Hymenobacter sp.]